MAALCCASGHAAQHLALNNLLKAGDNFVSTKQLYGGSVTQFSRQFKQFGWEVWDRLCDARHFLWVPSEVWSGLHQAPCGLLANRISGTS